MKVKVKKFQAGGQMPAQPAAPAPDGGGQGQGDPVQQLTGMVQQYMQTQDPQLADQIVMMVAQLLGINGGGDQGQQQAAGPTDDGSGGGEQMPMGKNGMKIKNVKGKGAYQEMMDSKKKAK